MISISKHIRKDITKPRLIYGTLKFRYNFYNPSDKIFVAPPKVLGFREGEGKKNEAKGICARKKERRKNPRELQKYLTND